MPSPPMHWLHEPLQLESTKRPPLSARALESAHREQDCWGRDGVLSAQRCSMNNSLVLLHDDIERELRCRLLA
jgi:hypothetical protein